MIMKKTFLIGASLLVAGSALGQTTAETKKETASGGPGSAFEEFRQKIHSDFQDFRHTILEHYADFLEGTWHEYEPLEPMKRSEQPKPVKIPDVTLDKPSTKPVRLPKPVLARIPGQGDTKLPSLQDELGGKLPGQTAPVTSPDLSGEITLPPSPFDPPKAEIPPEARHEVPLSLGVRPQLGVPVLGQVPVIPIPLPEEETVQTPEPVETPQPAPEASADKDIVKFYGMELLVPKVDFRISDSLEKVSDFARHWKALEEQDVATKVIDALAPEIGKMGLNDYLAYEFICAYMDSKFPQAGISPKLSAVHYLLANLGFNARIAVATKTGDPIILIPADQKLYGVTYMQIGGENFYVLGNRFAKIAGSPLATCDLPKVASQGKRFDMKVRSLNLPVKERRFDVKYGNLNLTGTVNENLMPMLYRYPQMDTGDYAQSVLDEGLRQDLVRQVKEQLGGKGALAATDELLRFVQEGFEYATDDDFHGFEKPYFLEENLFYPKNDCEDRAIFYTYLLWNALGVENQLLAFPGHESASVCLPGENISGTSYEHDGKRYYISDPTYIGSKTGMCMRRYEKTPPTVDMSYPDK